MSTTTKTHQSRWGYHPCSHADFLKLKKAHALTLRAYCDVKRYIRWHRKMEHNRKGPEPVAPTWLVEDGYHNLGWFDKNGYPKTFWGKGFKRDANKVNYYYRVQKEYQNARHPQLLENVRPMDLPGGFNKFIAELEDFYDKLKPQSCSA